ncbi:AEC family transporter [Campylobacter geochelonis]|uniref:Auxin efflux carrier (AEC) family protein n=1 Tax=Campylobacter geochelonis TaxID=1780362 RepID=A0A128EJV7_9BACT|nr:AEC family transporter [Campylobacter geochelonis]QKF71194.1 putative permease [Campylobacter geochelonis]CZE48811.1 auxin efflux carrier (AEC) family protein [Campylobacter geochelonis]CZE48841.1 auxin efflux carrier (AEC) family protein [Campylobacter geochelonis]CZE49994.1 auxin efflux carrier (AEC) family protein [Campylobacter geochelonis]
MLFAPLYSIFFLLVGGYFAKRVGMIAQKDSAIFLSFIVNFALPALIFDKIYHVSIHLALLKAIFLSLSCMVIVGIIIIFLGLVFKFSRVTIICLFLLSVFGNTLFVGLPVSSAILGDEMVENIVFYDQAITAIPVSIIAPIAISFAGVSERKFLNTIKQIFKFPPFLALILALILKSISIPELFFAPLHLIGNSIVPIALFSIGVGLSFNSIKTSWKPSLVAIFAKMILMPILFFAFLKLLKLDTHETTLGLILSSMPTAVIVSAIIMKANLNTNLAISATAMGHFVMFITLPIIYKFLIL